VLLAAIWPDDAQAGAGRAPLLAAGCWLLLLKPTRGEDAEGGACTIGCL